MVSDVERTSAPLERAARVGDHRDAEPATTPGSCTDSLHDQTYDNWEAVVVDDASDDDTAEYVRRRATVDSRLKLVEADGNGCAAARQKGLGAATGELLAYLDDDNLMANGWLRAVAEFFGRRTDVDVAYGAQIRLEAPNATGSEPQVLFEPFDEIRLTEGNYIDTGVIAHRAGLGVEHPAGVRGSTIGVSCSTSPSRRPRTTPRHRIDLFAGRDRTRKPTPRSIPKRRGRAGTLGAPPSPR